METPCCIPAPAQECSFGVLSPPLGSGRLKAVEMVAALARLGPGPAEDALIDAALLQRCMALFLQYPFNNLLHHQVRLSAMTLIVCMLHERASGLSGKQLSCRGAR